MVVRSADVPVVLGRNAPASAWAEGNPCEGCSAPCCKLMLLPQRPPQTFMALDYLRFLAGFPDAELILNRDGKWQLGVWKACRFLTAEDACSVRGMPNHPKTCEYFNPYDCWYKRNFHDTAPDDAPDVVRIDLGGLEAILDEVTVDPDGRIVDVPPYEELRLLAAKGRLTDRD